MDGFRFDLASALCRDPKGEPMAVPPLIEEIAKDPVLSKVALSSLPRSLIVPFMHFCVLRVLAAWNCLVLPEEGSDRLGLTDVGEL